MGGNSFWAPPTISRSMIEWFFAPFALLWRLYLLALTQKWIAATVAVVASTGYLVSRHRRRQSEPCRHKRSLGISSDPTKIVRAVFPVLPVHPNNGWELSAVCHGLRVFSKFSLFPTAPPAIAASTPLELPQKHAFHVAQNTKELPCWFTGIIGRAQSVRQTKGSRDLGDDVIKVTIEADSMGGTGEDGGMWWSVAGRLVSWIPGLNQTVTNRTANEDSIATVERSWSSREQDVSHLFLSSRTASDALPFHWSLLVFSSTKETGVSMATLIMLPKRTEPPRHGLPTLLAGQLCALREHITMKVLRAYSIHLSLPPPDDEQPLSHGSASQHGAGKTRKSALKKQPDKPVRPVSEGDQSAPLSSQANRSERRRSREIRAGGPAHDPQNNAPSSTSVSRPLPPRANGPAPSPQLSGQDSRYLELVEQTCQKLVAIADETEEDGWLSLGTTKDVFISKRPPLKGDAPINCVRGAGIIRAPPEFVIRLLKVPEIATQLDDLLKEIRIAKRITPSIALLHLLYKAVWPTTARDFALLDVTGQLETSVWVIAGVSVTDSRIPEEAGYVRAEIKSGGYVIRSCPGKEGMSDVTYVAQVDLKGNLPSFVVNKVSSTQPLCIANLRKLAEERYTALKDKPVEMNEFLAATKINWIFPDAAPQSNGLGSSTDEGQRSSAGGGQSALADNESVTLAESAHTGRKKKGKRKGERRESREGGEEEREGSGWSGAGEKMEEVDHFATPVVSREKEEEEEEGEIRLPPLPSHAQPTSPLPSTIPSPIPRLEKSDSHGSSDFEIISANFTLEGETPSQPLLDSDGMIVMETVEPQLQTTDDSFIAYTPEEFSSPEEEGGHGDGEGSPSLGRNKYVAALPPYEKPKKSKKRSRAEDAKEDDALFQSITEETISYPRSQGDVDYKTMGNQVAAGVLEELFHVSGINLLDPSTFTDQSSGWKFKGCEKDVVILHKMSEDSPFTNFMGKAIIELPPQEVYSAIRNPRLRFTYDTMLKEVHIVKQIEEGLYILHMQHETMQCFIKQARDFCILANERTEPGKMLLVGTSIDVSECPPNPKFIRGRIFYSGWVVEPLEINGKNCTAMTYLLQLDIGGAPAAIVNLVSRRQPLALHYLRQYLVSTCPSRRLGAGSSDPNLARYHSLTPPHSPSSSRSLPSPSQSLTSDIQRNLSSRSPVKES